MDSILDALDVSELNHFAYLLRQEHLKNSRGQKLEKINFHDMVTHSGYFKLSINAKLRQILQLYTESEANDKKRIVTALKSFLVEKGWLEVESCQKRGSSNRIKLKWEIPEVQSSGKLNFQELDILQFYEEFRDKMFLVKFFLFIIDLMVLLA